MIKDKFKNKIYLFLISLILILNGLNSLANADWFGNNKFVGVKGNYKQKLEDLKQIYNEDTGTISYDKIKQNQKDFKSFFRRGILVGGVENKKLIYEGIMNNYIYHLSGGIIEADMHINSKLPLYTKKFDYQEITFLSIKESTLSGEIDQTYMQDYIKNIKDLFRLNEIELNYGSQPKFIKQGNAGYFSISDFFWLEDNFWDIFSIGGGEGERLGDFLIPIETEKGWVAITLSSNTSLQAYEEYKTEEEAQAAENKYKIYKGFQVDNFLFDYCKDKLNKTDDETGEWFQNKNYSECGLLENDFDGDGINELILVDADYKISQVYAQYEKGESFIINSIFKSTKKMFKLMPTNKTNPGGDQNYASFLLIDWLSEGSWKNVLNNEATWQGDTSNLTIFEDTLTYKGNSSNYIYKDIYSKNGNGHSEYKMLLDYSFTGDSDQGGLYLNGTNGTNGIYLNGGNLGIGDNTNLNSATNFIYLNTSNIGINFKDSFVSIEKNSQYVEFVINGKTYFTLYNDGTYLSELDESFINVGGNLSIIFDNLNNINQVGIINSSKTDNDITIYDYNFSIISSANINLYGISNNNGNKYFQLKQILNLKNGNYSFLSSTNSIKPTNIVAKDSYNFDDEIKYNDKTKFLNDSDTIDSKNALVGEDIRINYYDFFSENNLYFQHKKEIYFKFDKFSQLYLIDPTKSNEDITIKGIDFGGIYSFLSNCAYEDIINNNLQSCTAGLLQPWDVDLDGWDEWIYNDGNKLEIFNNVIEKQGDTYAINFISIFKNNGLDYCNTFMFNLKDYKKRDGTNCDSNGTSCETDGGLIFQNENGEYVLYIIEGTDYTDKSYSVSSIAKDAVFICE